MRTLQKLAAPEAGPERSLDRGNPFLRFINWLDTRAMWSECPDQHLWQTKQHILRSLKRTDRQKL
jgi:hypothetical protein